MTIRAGFGRLLALVSGSRGETHPPQEVDPEGQELRQLLRDDWASLKMRAIYRRLPDPARQRVLDAARSWKSTVGHDSQSQAQKEV